MKVITPDDIKRINELYAKYKTYAEVSRQTGFAPGTVKKYVQHDYVPQEKREYIRFSGDLPPFKPEIFRINDWDPLCRLTKEEIIDLRELLKELDQ